MTRRRWFMTFGAGVCGSLLPACSSTAPVVVAPREEPSALLSRITEVVAQPEIQSVAAPSGAAARPVQPPASGREGPALDVLPATGAAKMAKQDEQLQPVSLPKTEEPAVTERANHAAPPLLSPASPADQKAAEEPLPGSPRC